MLQCATITTWCDSIVTLQCVCEGFFGWRLARFGARVTRGDTNGVGAPVNAGRYFLAKEVLA